MSYPVITFNSIEEWENYVNTEVVTNGAELITGVVGNNSYNGAVKFIKQSPLNWGKVALYGNGGDIIAGAAVCAFMGIVPDSLTWDDNIYNEYVFINMTGSNIPLAGLLVYYNLSGSAIDYIPANTSVNVFKATNDLWVQGNNSGSGGGSTQREPKTFIVGVTAGAPLAGTSTWQNAAFGGAWFTMVLNGAPIPNSDPLDGGPYTSKSLSSDTVTITNHQWFPGDILSYILITP